MSLRPSKLKDFVGQSKSVEKLKIITTAAKKRGEPLRHVLMQGPPGLGKTTLANILADELEKPIRVTSGPVLEKPHNIVSLLSGLEKGSVVFIDEIHRIPRAVEEYLYSAMEDFVLDVVIETENAQKTVRIQVPPFTLIGATTLPGMLTSPMLSRFPVTLKLSHYNLNELKQVATNNLKKLSLSADPNSIELLAKCARGTPRILNNFLSFLSDIAITKGIKKVTKEQVEEMFKMLEVHNSGLNSGDINVLKCIRDSFAGGPVGLKSIALALGEDELTLSNIHEPFLVTEGFVERTPRGRIITKKAVLFLEDHK